MLFLTLISTHRPLILMSRFNGSEYKTKKITYLVLFEPLSRAEKGVNILLDKGQVNKLMNRSNNSNELNKKKTNDTFDIS